MPAPLCPPIQVFMPMSEDEVIYTLKRKASTTAAQDRRNFGMASLDTLVKKACAVGLELGHTKCSILNILGDRSMKRLLVVSKTIFLVNAVRLRSLLPRQTYRYLRLEIRPSRGRAKPGWVLAFISQDLKCIQKVPFKPQQKL
ncbi:hypothetical protein E2C01_011533 [Portunus trituberculatus]|uniref:Uncharacterized protein n=1 Tax=Portunus trituberculatus TaxID=210409 RepID=A0A5B7DBF8_PORTR|nr:hypothetical protein [Portunus trituberculatus]